MPRKAGDERPPGSSEDLYARAQSGDRVAFERLIERHTPALWGHLTRLVGDADAGDVAQEIWLKILRGGYRSEGPFGAWLFRIAHNTCLDLLRRRGRAREVLADDGDEPTAGPSCDDDTGDVDDRDELARLLAPLSLEDRSVLLLVDREGLDYREAGRITGQSHQTVFRRVQRARAQVRQAYEAGLAEEERP